MSNVQSRLEKLEKLDDPYPRDFPGRETIRSILDSRCYEPGGKQFPSYTIRKIAGRISARRDHGDNIFFDIFDQTGSIQLHARFPSPESLDNLDELLWEETTNCDIGDMVGVEGQLSKNSREEPLLLISNFTLLAKALKDPPANFHGVKNPELKYRHREQDLMSSADSRKVFKKRSEIVFEIRKYLNERDFIEIETPVLQSIYGGATARPFVTHHQSLGQNYFLGISSELYLKRALVGGFDRVYSISRCFRNEGISPEHNPEFTNLEIFETCKTDEDMLSFTEDLIKYIACSSDSISSVGTLIKVDADLPAQDWPLSRKAIGKGRHKDRAEAWELYIDGMEIASGASDLNDPREQEKCLKKSEKNSLRKTTDLYGDKIMAPMRDFDPYDQNYIEALEMGALPVAGVGIGIDRLCMLLLGKKNIRDVMMFPLLRASSCHPRKSADL